MISKTFVVNSLTFEELKKSVTEYSKLGRILLVIDSFTDDKKHHTTTRDKEEFYFVRSTKQVIECINSCGWKLR